MVFPIHVPTFNDFFLGITLPFSRRMAITNHHQSLFCASGCPKVPGLGRSCEESRGDGAVGSSPADTGDAASSLKAMNGEMSVPRPCDEAPACALLGGWKHCIHTHYIPYLYLTELYNHHLFVGTSSVPVGLWEIALWSRISFAKLSLPPSKTETDAIVCVY